MSATRVVIPGETLGPISNFAAGPGTHIHESQLCASISGNLTRAPYQTLGATNSNTTSKLPMLSVSRPALNGADSAGTTRSTTILPDVDAIVLARVTRINPRQATVAILVVGESVCAEGDEFQGIIRVQDVRATEKDKVKIFTSFRPGDIVRAQVISLGDQQHYFLSTARNELGVVIAKSDGGETMYPVSWKECRDPVTGAGEARKVAKPF